MNNFSKKIAMVTGAASGIGLATVRKLVNLGAQVSMLDHDKSTLEITKNEFEEKCIQITCDVTNEKEVIKSIEKTVSSLGKIDIVLNSAGVAGNNSTIENMNIEEWKRVLDINLTGTFIVCKHVLKIMKKNNYGRIINIASVAGKEGNPNAGHYSSSKAGVIALTKSLGKELAETGILVNCITPAVINTNMLKQVTKEHKEYMKNKIPLGRIGNAEEVASMVVWLASDECSFSTAAVFDLSGGRSTY